MRAVATILANMFAAHEHQRDVKQRARAAAKARAEQINPKGR